MNAEELSSAMTQDGEEGVESFEKLFSKLQLMKGDSLFQSLIDKLEGTLTSDY